MSEATVQLRRILLPLDVSRDSLTALEIAFDLASAVGGEVSGLFIEDVALFAAGSLPFAREIGSFSGISQRIGKVDIEHRFRAVATKAREVLTEAGKRLRVHSSFSVARGKVSAEILTAATSADIVVLGKAGWSVGEFRRPGSTCLAILSQSRIPVLIVERGARLSPPILAVNDGTDAGLRAEGFAHELGKNLGWETAVVRVEGVTTGEDVLSRLPQDKPHLIVLPSSLPLGECPSELKWPILFVP